MSNIKLAVTVIPSILLTLATAFLLVKLVRWYRAIGQPQRRQHYDPYE